jgi:hypothetical protein
VVESHLNDAPEEAIREFLTFVRETLRAHTDPTAASNE